MGRAWAVGALIVLFSAEIHAEAATTAAAAQKPRVLALRLAPEWSYRRFSDSEPSSTDKHYAASGIIGANLHVDLYPFSGRADALGNLGFLASYAQALGLKSIDIDTIPVTEVATDWYQFDAGVQYRLPSSSRLSITLSAAYERWVFDFADDGKPLREVPTARYSLVRAGGDADYALDWIRLLGSLQVMLPLSIAPLGDREPTAGGFGARGKLGAAIDLTPMFAIDIAETYTFFTFHLPSVPGRADAPGTVVDQYFVTSLGLTLRL